ncbi:OST-HTH/LOTUS domain-containing protein [Stenotrophomonas sp.]|uniref:OST-HTH/LOTUS domain-containing protein n=1 Tax=Stenotrophomonas sp. TaxID=69392 RepID=UPI0028A1C40D|nr:OST-HTH/LOTUS domain-containing protein [Stenotrophomonas sp.]
MTATNQADLVVPQHEVQRLLGRCLLRLQQYEHLLKVMISARSISGTWESLTRAMVVERPKADVKTLGQLVGLLMGGYIFREEVTGRENHKDDDDGETGFHLQLGVNVPDDAYDALAADFRELVRLRNTLVHHFIEQHDLATVDGCLRAQEVLALSYSEIDRRYDQLSTLAREMGEAKQRVAELIQSPQFFELLVNGIGPDGEVHWHIAGIVGALRQAIQELSIDGWANLDAAVRWVTEHQPEQTPQKYGCVRWRHVVHESRQFELRRFSHNGQLAAWVRERQPAVPP